MGMFQPSEYQQAIFDFVTDLAKHMKEVVVGKKTPMSTRHAMVEAVAGSGKTKTIEEATKLIPQGFSVCFVAFNKAIAEELKRRAPPSVRAMTLNSMGFQALNHAMSANGKRAKLDTNKTYLILKAIYQTDEELRMLSYEEQQSYTSVVKKVVSLMKATLCPMTKESVEFLIERYNVESEGEINIDVLTRIVKMVIDQSKKVFERYDSPIIDFDDQIWLPLIYNLPMYKYDFLFVDETQDLNKAQLEMIIRAVKPEGSIIAVGDRNQSIYGFRGADVEAVPRIIETLNAKVFPLSITYRCPKSHVEIAKKFVPEIRAADWAEEGIVETIDNNKILEKVKPGDLMVCRYNAPLVKPCFLMIRNGIKATIRGRDIGEGLITLINKLKAKTMKEFWSKIDKWLEREKVKAASKGANTESIVDKYETIVALAEDADTVQGVIERIQLVFSDNTSAVVLSSIHKAKGLESDNVFVLQPQLMPSKYATKDWEQIQERNLQYVAYTRAKKALYLVK